MAVREVQQGRLNDIQGQMNGLQGSTTQEDQQRFRQLQGQFGQLQGQRASFGTGDNASSSNNANANNGNGSNGAPEQSTGNSLLDQAKAVLKSISSIFARYSNNGHPAAHVSKSSEIIAKGLEAQKLAIDSGDPNASSVVGQASHIISDAESAAKFETDNLKDDLKKENKLSDLAKPA